MQYLISTNQELRGNNFVPVTRVYNSNVITCPLEEYQPEAGEYLSDEKPVDDGAGEYIDFTIN